MVRSWQAEFEIIRGDIHTLSLRRTVFEQLNAEIERVTAGVEGVAGIALDRFLRPVYVEAQASLVRRLVDRDERSVSLRNLITDMMRHHEILTRERHVREVRTRWRNMGFTSGTDESANQSFDEVAGGSGQGFVPKAQLKSLRDELVKDVQSVSTHVNKFIAHRDRDRPAPMNWGQLNAALGRVGPHHSTVGSMLFPGLSDDGELLINGLDWQAAFRGLFPS